MFKRIAVSALVFGMAAIAPPVAEAQSTNKCGPRGPFVESLTQKYKEVSKGVGLSSATQVVEFWVSEETGTFSILVTYPNGMSCILAAGQNWTEPVMKEVKKGSAT